MHSKENFVELDSLAWQISCTGNAFGKSVIVDQENNIFVAGSFEDTLTIGKNILTAKNSYDGFIAKYDNTGRSLWVQQLSGLDVEFIQSLAIDTRGNTYLTGMFRSEIRCGDTLFKNKKQGAFLIKYSADGKMQWARLVGEGEMDSGKSVTVVDDEIIYVTGFMEVSLSTNEIYNTYNKSSAFIARYDSKGNEKWVNLVKGKDSYGESITSDSKGGIYMAGIFSDTLYEGGNLLTPWVENSEKTLVKFEDGFVAHYDSTGRNLWILRMGGRGIDTFGSVIADKSGGLFISGMFTNLNATFDNIPLISEDQNEHTLTNMDQFIAKIGSEGKVQWINNKIPSQFGNDRSLALDNLGNIYIGGVLSFKQKVAGQTFETNGSADLLITKFSSSGKLIWIKKDGGPGQENIGGITVSSWGDIYVTGSFQGTTTLAGSTFNSNKKKNIFVVRYRK